MLFWGSGDFTEVVQAKSSIVRTPCISGDIQGETIPTLQIALDDLQGTAWVVPHREMWNSTSMDVEQESAQELDIFFSANRVFLLLVFYCKTFGRALFCYRLGLRAPYLL